MANKIFTIAARPEEIKIQACTNTLTECMMRLVIDKNIEGLREFHRMGIPLDGALDYAVQKGSMPLIEELLNNLRVVPSDNTLLRAMQRGITIRNLFLARVTPTWEHLNSAVVAENYDTANILLDRGVEPNHMTIAMIKSTEKISRERSHFIDRVIHTVDMEYLCHAGSLRHLVKYTTIAQFERALDRMDSSQLPQSQLDKLLDDSLAASQPGHALMLIRRGAKFGLNHLNTAATHCRVTSDSNPKGDWKYMLRTVCQIAAEVGVLHESVENVAPIIHPLVTSHAFVQNEEFLSLCETISRACAPVIRGDVHRLLVTEIGRKSRRHIHRHITMEEVILLEDRTRPIFAMHLPEEFMELDPTP